MTPEYPMRLPLIPLLLSTALVAAPPLKLAVESAQVTLGPGLEPQPGTPPFQPRLEARFSLTGAPKAADLHFRFWRATSAALASLRKGRPIPAGAIGLMPVEGEVKPLEPNQRFQLTASAKGPWNGPESLVVEVLVKGRLAARISAPIVEKNLPGAQKREGIER
jgi:hypothetical protein